MSTIRISPRMLGRQLLQDFCERCYWYLLKVNFKLPFEFGMPGIMYNLDIFEKKIVRAY